MDNFTHSLVGVALSQAGLKRLSPHAIWLLVLSANAPDSDILALAGGPLKYFEWHRGYTHSLIVIPVLAAVVVAVVAAAARRRLPWAKAWALACIGIISHLLLDWTNSYGVRFLLPWRSDWFYLDIVNLYDGVLLAVLLISALWPAVARLVSSEIGERERSPGVAIARFAIVFFLAFDCGRAVLHHRAQQQLESRLYEDRPPLSTAALPDAFNPFRWTGVVDSQRAYYLFAPIASGDFVFGEPQTFYKIPFSPEILSARHDEAFRFFQYFARFPVWSVETVEGRAATFARVELSDLRFGQPGRGAFHTIALVKHNGTVLRAWFTYGDGNGLGAEPDLGD